MAYLPNFVPQPLGSVVVTAHGTPVALVNTLLSTVNASAPGGFVLGSLSDIVVANKVYLAALAANAGSVYVGSQNMNRTTLAGVVAIVPKGGSFSFTSNVNLNVYPVHTWFIDTDNDGDGLTGAIDQA